jgi:transposase
VDEQEPRPLRPQQVAISERSDRRRMETGRTTDPARKTGGGKRTVILREVVNGLMYILSTGCQWRAIPKDLPPKSSVYGYFDLWAYDGTLERIHHALYEQCRESADGWSIFDSDSNLSRSLSRHRHLTEVDVAYERPIPVSVNEYARVVNLSISKGAFRLIYEAGDHLSSHQTLLLICI